jgi:hypothetical protein
MTCDSCQMVAVNGVATHEHGCPDAWRGVAIDCRECGCDFIPQFRLEKTCPSCVSPLEDEEPWRD